MMNFKASPIARDLATTLAEVARYYPVVAVTGPRQSGKTTLCRALFSQKPYVSLEALDDRQFALEDPRGFLRQYPDGAILDEVQRVPQLLSYLQGEVDADPRPGRFVITGSQQIDLHAQVSQSLAGRVGMLQLLPLAWNELQRFANHPDDLWTAVWQGGYPRIPAAGIPPDRWLKDYIATYVERDVRQLLHVADLLAFTAFMRLCAGRTAQELNLSSLGADAGVSHNTARAWLSVLESSYLVQRIPARHGNARKQVVRAPKLHFVDTGLACALLGIQSPQQLVTHPLRGALFETWVVSEALKARLNAGLSSQLSHYRETRGLEVDLVVDGPAGSLAVEVKSGETLASDWLAGLHAFAARPSELPVVLRLVYGGVQRQVRQGVEVLPWREIPSVQW
jgi:predicted AAA+ superfamily ATPase